MTNKQQIIEVYREVLDEVHAQALYEHRKAKKAAQTVYGASLIAKELAKTPDPNAAVDLMIQRDWKGFNADWLPSGSVSPVDAFSETIDELERRSGHNQPTFN